MKYQIVFILLAFSFTSCVERGKPIKKVEVATETNSKETELDHYTCPKGHKGSDKQGSCSECGSVLVHNQLFHGNNVTLPKPTLNDPFNSNATNNTPTPAQNAYGDFHYTCPNGHTGGAGSAGNCSSCDATLVHNQDYHK